MTNTTTSTTMSNEHHHHQDHYITSYDDDDNGGEDSESWEEESYLEEVTISDDEAAPSHHRPILHHHHHPPPPPQPQTLLPPQLLVQPREDEEDEEEEYEGEAYQEGYEGEGYEGGEHQEEYEGGEYEEEGDRGHGDEGGEGDEDEQGEKEEEQQQQDEEPLGRAASSSHPYDEKTSNQELEISIPQQNVPAEDDNDNDDFIDDERPSVPPSGPPHVVTENQNVSTNTDAQPYVTPERTVGVETASTTKLPPVTQGDIETGDKEHRPNPEEALDPEENERRLQAAEERRRRIWGCIECISMLLCMVVIFVVSFTLARMLNDDDGGQGKSQNSTDAATPEPTLDLTDVQTSSPATNMPSLEQTGLASLYSLVGGPFTGDPSSSFGASSAMDDIYLALGAPTILQGFVSCFLYSSANQEWNRLVDVVGYQDQSAFGASVDIAGDFMVVGAPMLFAEETLTPSGAVYFYVFDSSSNRWERSSDRILRGQEDAFAANEEFGRTVSLSSNSRLAVGAPLSNYDGNMGIGRVYTFDIVARQVGVTVEETPLLGETAGDRFGSSVSMSRNGRRFLVGAPGAPTAAVGGGTLQTGYVALFEQSDNVWEKVTTFRGTVAGGRFGAHVAMISTTGFVFAVGVPGHHDNGAGRIVVYEEALDGTFLVLEPIDGQPGDALGENGTFRGTLTNEGIITIVAGTSRGTVQRFDWNSSAGKWESPLGEVAASLPGPVTSISISVEHADEFVVGSASAAEAAVYEVASTSPGQSA